MFYELAISVVHSSTGTYTANDLKELVENNFENREGAWIEIGGSAALASIGCKYPILVYAATYGRADFVELLVQRFGCDVNVIAKPQSSSQTHFKRTALHMAVMCGHTDVVDMLLKLGADAGIKDAGGMLPIDILECRNAFNDIGQVCSHQELKRYDNEQQNIEERRTQGRLQRVNMDFSESERERMKDLLIRCRIHNDAAVALGIVSGPWHPSAKNGALTALMSSFDDQIVRCFAPNWNPAEGIFQDWESAKQALEGLLITSRCAASPTKEDTSLSNVAVALGIVRAPWSPSAKTGALSAFMQELDSRIVKCFEPYWNPAIGTFKSPPDWESVAKALQSRGFQRLSTTSKDDTEKEVRELGGRSRSAESREFCAYAV